MASVPVYDATILIAIKSIGTKYGYTRSKNIVRKNIFLILQTKAQRYKLLFRDDSTFYAVTVVYLEDLPDWRFVIL